jgi:hypothetical protein
MSWLGMTDSWGGYQKVINYFYGDGRTPPPARIPVKTPPVPPMTILMNKSVTIPLISQRDKPWLFLKTFDIQTLRANVILASLSRTNRQDYLTTVAAMDENPQFPLLFKAIEITNNPNNLVRIDNPDGIISEIFIIDIAAFHK